METMQTALARIMTARLAQHRRGGNGNPYRISIQHTAYNGTPGRLSLQREWGWMETMKTALAHISTYRLTEEQHL